MLEKPREPVVGWKPLPNSVPNVPIVTWTSLLATTRSGFETILIGKQRIQFGSSSNLPPVLSTQGIPADISVVRQKLGGTGMEVEFSSGSSFCVGRSPDIGTPFDHSQDFGGVIIGDDSKVKRFAVADGVGEALASRSVAELAVNSALKSPIRGSIGNEALKGVILGAETSVKDAFDRDAIMVDIETRAANPMLKNAWLQKVAAGEIGSTTLISGVRHSDRLHIAQLGDGGWVVLGNEA